MKRYTIGILIGNANSPHAKELIRGIYNAAERLDVNVMFFLGLHMTYYYHAYFGDEIDYHNDYQYNVLYDYAHIAGLDALIISYGSLCIFLEDQDKHHFLNRVKGIPYVLLEDYDDSKKGTSIITDNYKGMYQIVEHLVKEHGYRRITYLSGPDNNTDAKERQDAFEDVLKKYEIPLRPEMIEKGDYSECVEEQIETLFSNNPDMEAMVCANDTMAVTAYRICEEKGLVVGRDIAVTGYDDCEYAETMFPPLTTVQQNEFDMGYMALKNAKDLCEGKNPVSLVAPAIVKIRASCGCKNATKYKFPPFQFKESSEKQQTEHIEDVIRRFCGEILVGGVSREIEEGISDHLRKILKQVIWVYREEKISKTDKKVLTEQIDELLTGRYGNYVSKLALIDGLNSYFKKIIHNESDAKKTIVLSDVFGVIQRSLQSSIIKVNRDGFEDFQRSSMFLPLVSRDMMKYIKDDSDFYRAPMRVLRAIHTKSSKLFILNRPIVHKYAGKWTCPEKLYLVSRQEGDDIVSYNEKERIEITKKHGISKVMDSDQRYVLSICSLYSGELQYGLLAAEINPEDMVLLHVAAMQISIALNFQELYKEQYRNQVKLEKLVREVNEKNKILKFISEFDELTGCLNRRGFMERAMKHIHENEGEKAVLIIADLDHLKEINDCFGHDAGDFAIKESARLLREAFGAEALVARIGGDEFVVLSDCKENISGKDYISLLRKNTASFNEQSNKPYYVELSAGFTIFACDSLRDLNSIIAESDLILYEAKRTRRKSIKRDNK